MRQLAEPIARPSPQLIQSCSSPVDLPERDMSAGEVERAWGQDRASLVDCGARHEATVSFYRNRDARLAGK